MGIFKGVFALAVVMVFSLLSCGSAKPPATPFGEIPKVIFGYGGGFAGKEHSYTITERGWLYSGDGEISPYKYLGRVQRTKAAQLVQLFTTLGLHQIDYRRPDNTYFFVGYSDGKMQHRIVWSNHREVASKVTDYYQLLMDVIKPFLKK